jgi:hypothetical protein
MVKVGDKSGLPTQQQNPSLGKGESPGHSKSSEEDEPEQASRLALQALANAVADKLSNSAAPYGIAVCVRKFEPSPLSSSQD